MRPLAVLAAFLLASVLSQTARADYLEIRKSAWVKRAAESDGEQLENLASGTLVSLRADEQENGYYKVRTRNGTRGYVYRTLVRRHPGELPAVSATEPSIEGPQPGLADGFSAAGSASSIRIATFNIQNLGKTKMGKPAVVRQLVDIVRDYPLVAVQELSDAANTVPGAFLTKINEDGGAYDALVSQRSGTEADDKKSQEQYAFYFDTRILEARSSGELFDDSAHDFFQREPYVARFKVRASNFTFVIATIHTKPGDLGEIEHLDDVVQWARGRFPDEDDFVVVGDFNAGCSYASPEDMDEFTIRNADSYSWIVPDDADTNLAAAACAYDRIVVTPGLEQRLVTWGVDRAFSDKKVSDHWPVWAEFRKE